jgi:hypothetical protein
MPGSTQPSHFPQVASLPDSDTCVFCGYSGPRSDFPPAHWIPAWLNRRLFTEYATGVRHNLPDRSWEAEVFELVVYHVCGNCNSTWLSEIETKAANFVFPLIMGVLDPNSISVPGLYHAARWLYLKTVSLELGRPDEHPATHAPSVYAAFRQTRKPPYPNCSMALGYREIEASSEPHPVFVWFSSVGGVRFSSVPARFPSLDGYHTTLLVGHVVVDVFGITVAVPCDADHGDGYVPLWPSPVRTGGTFTWPPKRVFRWNDGLEITERKERARGGASL